MSLANDIDAKHPPTGRRAGTSPAAKGALLKLGFLTAMVLCGVAAAFAMGIGGIDDMIEMAQGLGVWGPLAFVALMVVHCFVPFPAEILALAAGAAFGDVVGTAAIWVGAMLGAALSFWLSRVLGREAVESLLPARHRAALDEWATDMGATTLLLGRFMPVIAFNLINYAAGLTRVRWWTFLWTTGVGILPLTFLMVHLGSRMVEMEWQHVLAVSVVGIVAVSALAWGLRRLGLRRLGLRRAALGRPKNAGSPDR